MISRLIVRRHLSWFSWYIWYTLESRKDKPTSILCVSFFLFLDRLIFHNKLKTLSAAERGHFRFGNQLRWRRMIRRDIMCKRPILCWWNVIYFGSVKFNRGLLSLSQLCVAVCLFHWAKKKDKKFIPRFSNIRHSMNFN